MPIIDEVGRKTLKMRLVTFAMYLVLTLLGITMVFPFLITLTSSVTNSMDYYRFSPVPTAYFSRDARFMKGLVTYFPESLAGSLDQAHGLFNGMPSGWGTWKAVGDDKPGMANFVRAYLAIHDNPACWQQARRMAADYSDFAGQYTLDDSICSFIPQQVAPYMRAYYRELARKEEIAKGPDGRSLEKRALAILEQKRGIEYDSFYTLPVLVAYQSPLIPAPDDPQAQDFYRMKQAYREYRFLPNGIKTKWRRYLRSSEARAALGLSGSSPLKLSEMNQTMGTGYGDVDDVPFPVTATDPPLLRQLWRGYTGSIIPACETRPFPMKVLWLGYLDSDAARKTLGLGIGSGHLAVDEYNKAFGTRYASLREMPFPVSSAAPQKLSAAWQDFIATQYPARLIEVRADAALHAAYRQFLRQRFKDDLPRCNSMLNTTYASWVDVRYPARIPAYTTQANLWQEYLAKVPVALKIPHSAEEEYQQFLLRQYGSLPAVNKQYGWHLTDITQAEMPFDMAYLVSFVENDRQWTWNALFRNYGFVFDYLTFRGRALWNTAVLLFFTLLAALTVNPMAAYAMSRFKMRQMPSIILFMLATMAFPTVVTMIPGYLLMRDLHMLNTYAALILPGIANGMSIFILKGFFDSLPPELYEAATLDGAKEWQVFWTITLPLSKPVLAVIALNSFLATYGAWEWALIVCQKQQMWTLSVWLYQFNTQWATEPWTVMASFVIASIPVFLVFTFCQNIILRGIILPQMK